MTTAPPFTFVDQPRDFTGATLTANLPATIASKQELLAALARALGFPLHFGHNWDALEESLREFSWAKSSKSIALVHEGLPGLGEDDLRIYLEILAASITGLRKAKDAVPALQAVFPRSAIQEIDRLLR